VKEKIQVRKHNLGLVLAVVALAIGCSTPTLWAQSDNRGVLNKLFESQKKRVKTATAAAPSATATPAAPGEPTAEASPATESGLPAISPKTQEDALAAISSFMDSEKGKAVMKKAEDTLAKQDTDELMKKAEGIMKDPNAVNSAIEQGKSLGQDQGFNVSADQVDQVKGLIGGASKGDLKAAADQFKALKPVAGQTEQPRIIPGVLPGVGGPVPEPQNPISVVIPRPTFDAGTMTKITADKAEFNTNTNQVTFEGNVKLDHPEFDMNCEVLVAYLKKGADDAPKPEGANPMMAAAGGIDHAVAKGYVEIEKLTPDGKYQVAKSRNAVFDAGTGDVTLTDFPSLQDGNNLIRGTTEATTIELRRNGTHNVKGPATYTLDSGGKTSLGGEMRGR